jgi:hypothetical protein
MILDVYAGLFDGHRDHVAEGRNHAPLASSVGEMGARAPANNAET